MEIKNGEYIRTKKGYIARLKEIEEDETYFFDSTIRKINGDTFKHLYPDQFEKYIEKHSFSIIDLIEVGDYVNKKRVIEVYRPEGTYVEFIKLDDELPLAEDEEIKSIVTKEQFEAMEYEVE